MILFVPFGPRLDRPDAVGDEGRPRAAALFVATLLAGAGVFATATLAGLGSAANLTATGAGFCVAGVALFGRERPLVRVGAHLLFFPGLLVALLGVLTGIRPPDPVAGVAAALGVALTVAGGAAAWAGVLGDDEMRDAVTQGMLAVVVVLVVAVPVLIVLGVGAVASAVFGGVVFPDGTRPRPASLVLLVAFAAAATRVALGALPLSRLVGRERRASVAADLATARRGLSVATVVAAVAWVVLAVAGLLGYTDGVWALLPGAAVRAAAAATGAVVRVPLAVVGAVALAAAAAAVLARRLAGRGGEWLGTTGLPFVGAAVLLVVLSPVLLFVAAGSVDEPVTIGVGLVLVVLLAVVLSLVVAVELAGLATLPVAAWVGLLPERSAGAALLAAGTLVVAAAGGLAGAPVVAVVGTTAAALAAWDLGSYATDLTAEVGHAPRVRPLEYRRALRSVGVAGAGAVVAVGVGVLGGTPTTGLLPAAALAVVGIVPLVLLLRP